MNQDEQKEIHDRHLCKKQFADNVSQKLQECREMMKVLENSGIESDEQFLECSARSSVMNYFISHRKTRIEKHNTLYVLNVIFQDMDKKQ